MSSRNAILERIQANKPTFTPLPTPIVSQPVGQAACLEKFVKSAGAVGGIVHLVPDLAGIGAYLEQNFSPSERIWNTVAGIGIGLGVRGPIANAHELHNVEIAIVQGTLGVAENGAVWVTEANLPTRVLPFICEHLMLVISQNNLVSTMHTAYARLDVASNGYGVFIAGPSRTADIEQSLVIGAHGPKRAHVFIVQD